jgi:hypothetical protein
MNRNSSTNQDIKRKFVDREIVHLFTYPMEACLAAGQNGEADMPQLEDIENLFIYPEYQGTYARFEGGTDEEREEEIERLREEHDQYVLLKGQDNTELLEEIEALENLDTEPQEIYEWWIVTSYLYEQLQNKGEPVIEWCGLHLWGRGTSGQAILLDSVISDICEDMEILEGQRNSWAETEKV